MPVLRRNRLAMAIANALPLMLATRLRVEQHCDDRAEALRAEGEQGYQANADGQGDDVGIGHGDVVAQASLSTPLNSVESC